MSETKRDWQALIYPQNTATAPPVHGQVVGLKRVPVDRDWAFTPEDAHLISAAPDLLAACEEAEGWCENVAKILGAEYSPAKQLRAAVAKAKGA